MTLARPHDNARRRLRHLTGALLCAALTLFPVASAANATSPDTPDSVEITDTARGRAALAETERRLAPAIESGQLRGLDLADYRVIEGIPGDPEATWVIPAGAELPEVTVTDAGIQVTSVATPDRPRLAGIGGSPGRVGTAAAGTLTWQSAYCFARYTEAMGWFDHCRQYGYVANDGDSTLDHWVLKQYGTCKSNAGWRMSLCSLSSSRPSGSPTQYWEDWAPKSDTSGSCRAISISVSAFGVGVSGSYSGCETNDITKGAAPGSFTSAWKGSVASSERAVQSQIAVGVPQGRVPTFTLTWDIHGYLNI